jgi:zinc protease
VKEAKELKASDMIAAFRDALKYSGTIIYTGQKDFQEVADILRERISWTSQPVASEYIVLDRKQYSEPMVFLHDNNKARQGNIHFFVEGQNLQDENEYADMTAFNDYFGSGMSSIVFQEIREFRSLAYTAYSIYNRPQLKDKPGYLSGYLNTQSDKTIEGIEALSQLILEMPEKPDRMDGIRKGLTLNSFTSFPDFRSIGSRVANWRRLGYEQDPGEMYEKYFSQIQFENIVDFYKKQVHGRPLIISVSGQMKKIDTGKLEKLGKIRFLKYNQFIRE